jgi:putative transposase
MSDTLEKRRRGLRLKHFDYSQAGSYFVTICTHERKPILGSVVAGKVILTAAGEAVAGAWLRLPDRFPSVVLHEFVVMPNHLHGILTITQPIRPTKAGAASSAPTEPTGQRPRQMGAARSGPTELTEEGPKRMGAASSAPTEATGEGPERMDAASSCAPAQIKDVTGESGDRLLNAGKCTGVGLGKILRAFKSLSGIELNRILGRSGGPVWQRNYFEHIVRGEDDFRKIQKYIHENALRWEDDPDNF